MTLISDHKRDLKKDHESHFTSEGPGDVKLNDQLNWDTAPIVPLYPLADSFEKCLFQRFFCSRY